MATVVVKEILGGDIFSRQRAKELCEFVNDDSEGGTIMDFAGVNFISRSFMDEFYNLFVKNDSVVVINMTEDNKALLEVVKSTQTRRNNTYFGQKFYRAETFEDADKWFEASPI